MTRWFLYYYLQKPCLYLTWVSLSGSCRGLYSSAHTNCIFHGWTLVLLWDLWQCVTSSVITFWPAFFFFWCHTVIYLFSYCVFVFVCACVQQNPCWRWRSSEMYCVILWVLTNRGACLLHHHGDRSERLHGALSQKTVILILATLRTWNIKILFSDVFLLELKAFYSYSFLWDLMESVSIGFHYMTVTFFTRL